jgi:hypothetical protein
LNASLVLQLRWKMARLLRVRVLGLLACFYQPRRYRDGTDVATNQWLRCPNAI